MLKHHDTMFLIILVLSINLLLLDAISSVDSLIHSKTRYKVNAVNNVPEYEILALYDLYNATMGTEWRWGGESGAQWVFNTSTNPCSPKWQGIQCSNTTSADGYLHVEIIYLPYYSLHGYIPDSISNLTYLNYLDLSNNILSVRPLPNTIGSLHNLVTLNLEKSSVIGNIPSSINGLWSLQTLDLGYNILNGELPIALCNLTALTSINVEVNLISGSIPACIGQLSQLKELQLYDNFIQGTLPLQLGNLTSLLLLGVSSNSRIYGTIPYTLSKLVKLEILDVSQNKLTGTIPEYFGNYTYLQYMDVSFNHFNGTIPASFGNLSNLNILKLYQNYLTGTIPQSLTKLSKLYELSLHDNILTGIIPLNLGFCSQLQYLYLHDNYFTGTIPYTFANFTQMIQIFLVKNYFTGSIPSIFQNYTQLQSFAVNANQFTGSIPSYLLDQSELVLVELSNNQLDGSFPAPMYSNWYQIKALSCATNYLTGVFPIGLDNSPVLQYLNLSDNILTSTIPLGLGGMVKMNFLYLGLNLFSGSLPDVFNDLPNLSYLFLDSNLLTGTIPGSLGYASLLQSVNLSSNHLTGTIPTSLSQLSALSVLLLQDNALTGNIYVFNSAVFSSLNTVQLSDNQLTGTLPDALGKLAGLHVFAAVSNCFTGSLPESLCDSLSLLTLSLDGMQSASACQQQLFPAALEGKIVAQSLYSIRSPITGGIPECLFRMPNLTTLHLSGNGLTGSLSSSMTVSASLSDLSLSHNKLEGRIPSVVLQRQWSTLDLSYNRFTGTLEHNTLSQYPANTSMYLGNNRLSGRVPGGFLHLTTVDVLQSNLFSCRDDRSDLPQNDPNLDKYECGSVVVDGTLYTWIAAMTCSSILLLTVLYWQSARCKQLGMMTWQQLQGWWTAVDSEVPQLQQLFSLLSVVVQTAALCAIYCMLVLLPVYAVCSAVNGTYTYQYAWSLSAAYLSGEASFAAEAVFLLGLVMLAIVCLRVLLARTQAIPADSNGTASEGEEKVHNEPVHADPYRWYILFFMVTVLNFVVVLGVNIAYVIIVLSQGGNVLIATQTALAVFKVVFNGSCSPMLLRWASQRFLGTQVSVLGFMAVQLTVSIVNNIFIPCLVVAIINPSCFYNIFESAGDVSSSYSYQGKCGGVLFETDRFNCLEQPMLTAQTSYSPPFAYSFQCSSSFVTYYTPAFVNMCILAGFVIPLGQVVLQRLHSRAVVGTRLFQLLDQVLPRVLKPVQENPTRSEYAFFHNAGQQLVTVLTYLAMLLTFGAIFPPLTLCLAVTMVSILVFARLKVGWLLVQAREQGRAEEYARILDQECVGINSSSSPALVNYAVQSICCFACGFYTLFLFDTLGDVQGLSGAYWVLIVCPTILPVVLWLQQGDWNKWRRDSTKQNDVPGLMVDTELSTVTSTRSPMFSTVDNTF